MATTFGWLVLLCPLVGTVAIALDPDLAAAGDRADRRAAPSPAKLVILVFAFYPQFGLRRSEPTLKTAIAPVRALIDP